MLVFQSFESLGELHSLELLGVLRVVTGLVPTALARTAVNVLGDVLPGAGWLSGDALPVAVGVEANELAAVAVPGVGGGVPNVGVGTAATPGWAAVGLGLAPAEPL